MIFPQILNMHTLQDLNIVAHHTLQDIIKIMLEGALHVISRSRSSQNIYFLFCFSMLAFSTHLVFTHFTPAPQFLLTVLMCFRHITDSCVHQVKVFYLHFPTKLYISCFAVLRIGCESTDVIIQPSSFQINPKYQTCLKIIGAADNNR